MKPLKKHIANLATIIHTRKGVQNQTNRNETDYETLIIFAIHCIIEFQIEINDH